MSRINLATLDDTGNVPVDELGNAGGGEGGDVFSVNGHAGVVVLSHTDVGADASGAAATAQAAAEAASDPAGSAATETTRAETAEALLIPLTQKGAANGVASLDGSAKVTAAQLPTVITATQQAGDYTFALTDAGTVVEGTKATAQAFTIPPHSTVAFPVGTVLEVFQDGAGAITLTAGAGVTLRSDGSKVATAAQYATVGLRQRAQDEWVLTGDLA